MSKNNSSEELLARIQDLEKQIKVLKDRKKFGLVWEDKPEEVVLQCETNVPILKEIRNRKLVSDNSQSTNILIEGDNYHSLSVLNYTHKGKVDVVYIDPPYNTGAKDWKYNNDYVDSEDVYRHSKWLSFMHNRLLLARQLLKKDGFLICAIDHNELFTLGALLDGVMGEQNRIGVVTVLHNPKGRNQAKYFSANSEFMLVYAYDIKNANFNKVVLTDDVQASFDQEDDNGKFRLEPFMRARTVWSRERRPKNWYPIYVSNDLKELSSDKRSGFHEVYPITNNGKEMAWKNVKESFDDLNDGDYFVARKEDNKIRIYHKYREQQVLKNVWLDQRYQSEFHGTNVLKNILGENIFDYPKSLYLVLDALKLTAKKNAVVVDFFAGSGTTGHAVLELNKDGGNRRFILCTNNENKIAEEVTYERLKKVIKGYKDKRGERIGGLGGNLSYYKTDLVSIEKLQRISDESKIKITYQAGEMIAIRENTLNEADKNEWWQIFENEKSKTAIYFKEDKSKLPELVNILEKENKPTVLYIFGWGKNEYKNEYSSKNIRVEDIPEPIIEVYKEINRI